MREAKTECGEIADATYAAFWREQEAGNTERDRGGYYGRGWRDGYAQALLDMGNSTGVSRMVEQNQTETRVVRFERIGRNRNVPDMPIVGDPTDLGSLSEQVFMHARGHLGSRDFEVWTLEDGTVLIGGGRFGRGSVVPASPPVGGDAKAFVWRIHAAVVDALAPDDPTGHIPNCGYTYEVPECGCAAFGERLHAALSEVITPTAGATGGGA